MGSKRKVQRLDEACIDSIAYNLVHHAKKLKRCPIDSDMYETYKAIQYLFTPRILKALERIQRKHDYSALHGFSRMQKAIPSCLRFLLNEHTTRFDGESFWAAEGFTPSKVLAALQNCKELQILQMKYTSFPKELFVACLPLWQNLVSVDLYKSLCDDEIMMGIFENCPDIQALRVSGEAITNRTLFSLCKNHRRYQNFPFCAERGECCNLGKKLTTLKAYGTQIDENGLACALQHLQCLRILEDGFLNSPSSGSRYTHSSHVWDAICLLRRTSVFQGLNLPQLKLNTLFISTYEYRHTLNAVSECCPELQRLFVEVSVHAEHAVLTPHCFLSLKEIYLNNPLWHQQSIPQFREFLRTKGPQLEIVSLSASYGISLGLISSILRNCSNLKQLHIGNKKCFRSWGSLCEIVAAEHEDGAAEIFSCIENLGKIRLYSLYFREVSSARFLSELLIQALNVKDLTICGILVEQSLKNILERNNFNKLEKIEVTEANLKDVSLEPLLSSNSNLKKIAIRECNNARTFIEKHQNIVQRNDLQLDIESL